jgi:hypothetical protein
MTSLIEDLKKKAIVDVWSHDCWGRRERYTRLDEEKFAILIIQECINIVESCGELSSWTAAEEIQKRFS